MTSIVPGRDEAVGRLAAAGCVAPEREANELVVAAPDHPTLEAWICRREQGEPLAWITGTMLYCGHSIRVHPGVYVPRHQTQALAHRAATLLPDRGRAVDLCTGSGAVAVHLRSVAPAATVVGVDIDPAAVVCARHNGVTAVLGGLDAPLRPATFDLVTAVAPYVPTDDLRLLPIDVQRHEPRQALDGGPDGLDLVRRIIGVAAHLLRPGGWLLTEVGGEQEGALRPTLRASGFGSASPWFDDDGDLRGVVAQLTAPS